MKTSVLLTWEIPETFKSEVPLKVGRSPITSPKRKQYDDMFLIREKKNGNMLSVHFNMAKSVRHHVLLLDPVQPAECGRAGQPEEEVDYSAAA